MMMVPFWRASGGVKLRRSGIRLHSAHWPCAVRARHLVRGYVPVCFSEYTTTQTMMGGNR